MPITGNGAPADLSIAQTATWAQSSYLPRVGTAVLPASHVPSPRVERRLPRTGRMAS